MYQTSCVSLLSRAATIRSCDGHGHGGGEGSVVFRWSRGLLNYIGVRSLQRRIIISRSRRLYKSRLYETNCRVMPSYSELWWWRTGLQLFLLLLLFFNRSDNLGAAEVGKILDSKYKCILVLGPELQFVANVHNCD